MRIMRVRTWSLVQSNPRPPPVAGVPDGGPGKAAVLPGQIRWRATKADPLAVGGPRSQHHCGADETSLGAPLCASHQDAGPLGLALQPEVRHTHTYTNLNTDTCPPMRTHIPRSQTHACQHTVHTYNTPALWCKLTYSGLHNYWYPLVICMYECYIKSHLFSNSA